MYLGTKTDDDDNMKYNEDKILKEVIEYIEKTYSEHYSVDKSGFQVQDMLRHCLLYTSPSPRDGCRSRMPSSA